MKIIVGITGASGSIYGVRLIEVLREKGIEVVAIATTLGHKVCFYETGIQLSSWFRQKGVRQYEQDNLFAAPASGSVRNDGVFIVPCSMGTLGRIAGGLSSNLLERVADVALKERFQLILGVRETPLNQIHMENMLRCARAGAVIAPLTVGFYIKPKTLDQVVDFQVGKLLDLLGIEHDLFVRWGAEKKVVEG